MEMLIQYFTLLKNSMQLAANQLRSLESSPDGKIGILERYSSLQKELVEYIRVKKELSDLKVPLNFQDSHLVTLESLDGITLATELMIESISPGSGSFNSESEYSRGYAMYKSSLQKMAEAYKKFEKIMRDMAG